MVKNLPSNTTNGGLIPALQRSPGGGNGNPLQYSYVGNPMDRGAWWAQSMGLQNSRHDLAAKQQQLLRVIGALLVVRRLRH